jgi:kynurenine formamidase
VTHEQAATTPAAEITPASVRETGKRLSNWGRWGKDDEFGTLNFVTAGHVVAAAGLVRTGRRFCLAIPINADGPQDGSGGRFNPVHGMNRTGNEAEAAGGLRSADDFIVMPLQCATQLDSLAHIHYDGRLYNGYPSSTVTVYGAARNSIDKLGGGIVTRGVLVDVPRSKGLPWLPDGYPITVADLEVALREQSDPPLGTGDALVLRTGSWAKYLAGGTRDELLRSGAGLAFECCEWLREREVAAVCADNCAVEVQPDQNPAVHAPAHMVLIRDVGMTLGELFFLEDLAADCAADGRWDFMFTASPLPVTAAVGSPLNPLAIK